MNRGRPPSTNQRFEMSSRTVGIQERPVPRPEFPRPDFERQTWLNLNGSWDFAYDDENVGVAQRWFEDPVRTGRLNKSIVVPFCYQSEASGLSDTGMHEVLWYSRTFELTEAFLQRRVLLKFGAVDYEARVWVNGREIGVHCGGNTPFAFDITDALESQSNTVTLRVEDRFDCSQPRGKQIWKQEPEACWYWATSGIWQTVWLEAVGSAWLEGVRFTADLPLNAVRLEVRLAGSRAGTPRLSLRIAVRFETQLVCETEVALTPNVTQVLLDLKHGQFYDSVKLWSPQTPNLYDVEFVLVAEGRETDRVKSYFGLRTIEVAGDLILLNGSPLRQKLVLDQGYWPESLMTAPDDAALIRDIELARAMGFNGARKHQKVEDPRYYYHADRLGFLVWGELPSTYDFSSVSMGNLLGEMTDFINRDYNHPSLVTWVTLNESWGTPQIRTQEAQQRFSLGLYYLVKATDPTRLVSSNDGWEQTITDLCAIHDYEPDGARFVEKTRDLSTALSGSFAGRMIYAQGYGYRGEPILISEFGGIGFRDERASHWGYFGPVENQDQFFQRLSGLLEAFRQLPWIRGYCYTQLTDVFQEVNGLLTMNREPKVPLETLKALLDRT